MKELFPWLALRRLLFFLLSFPVFSVCAQKTIITDSTDSHSRMVIAGQEYKSSSWHTWMWGEDYREEWSTPVKIPVLNLDSAFGGLTVVKQGGGRQTKSLRLADASGRQYVLRTVNKTYSGALPEVVQGTFIERLANDQIATNHPYAALTVPRMAEAGKIYHTNPEYYVVPYSPRLGEYNESFANTLCLLEERPDETQISQESFGNPEDIVSTEKMLEKITEQNDHLIDQNAYVKTRLFDMFVGDWGRHRDNWRWAKFESGSNKIYRPVPKDRDQTYAKFEGFLLSIIVGSTGLKQLQTFDDKIHDINWYNYPAINLDRRFTNELTRQVWIDSAKALQQYLTDDVIENAVRQMPPEIFARSGEEIIRKLKSRRNDLDKYAGDYYDFLSKQVDIPGSKEDELFMVQRSGDGATSVAVYPIKKNREIKNEPIFSRTFLNKETNEIRLYGLDGNDVYHISGSGSSSIRLRLVGGPGIDSVVNESSPVHYYDIPGDVVRGKVKKHLSYDTSITRYDFDNFVFDKKGFGISPNYTNTRGAFIELGYKETKQQWRKEPFGWQQVFKLNYSFFNKSFGGDYKGIFNEAIGKWNILLNASYDQQLKNYFFGLGNETVYDRKNEYYNLHTEEGKAIIGFNRIFAKYNSITLSASYDMVRVKNENAHFISETLPANDPTVFNSKNFAGAQLSYAYYYVNNEVVPTKGFGFSVNGSHTKNLSQTNRSFTRYWTTVGFYIPLGKKFSFASRNGASTVDGKPEFYQYNWIGGGQNLRGFHRERFYGKTSFYNDNELRWIPDVKGYLFNGKIGLIGFLDNGRVWMPGVPSAKWHVGYGAGLLLSPFNKVAVTAYYGMSDDDKLIHIRLGRFF